MLVRFRFAFFLERDYTQRNIKERSWLNDGGLTPFRQLSPYSKREERSWKLLLDYQDQLGGKAVILGCPWRVSYAATKEIRKHIGMFKRLHYLLNHVDVISMVHLHLEGKTYIFILFCFNSFLWISSEWMKNDKLTTGRLLQFTTVIQPK